jgi:ABC-type antimicrobial peptide transport system permease subunit
MRAGAWVVVRHDGPSTSMTASVRAAIRRADGRIPINTVRALETFVAEDIAAPRFRALLVVLFGSLALILAAVGVAGVLAFMVSQRIREIGVRLALGARPLDVVTMIVRESARLTALGVALGLLGAAATARILSGFLFGVTALDPIVFGAVTLVLALVGVAASVLPARRAVAVDPNIALRAE